MSEEGTVEPRPAPANDTLAEFKNTFSYGSRHSGVFKFLKGLSPEDAATFIERFLKTGAASLDDGNYDRLALLIQEWQVRNYSPKEGAKAQWIYPDGPFVRISKPLEDAKIGLLSAGGHFVEGSDPSPFGITAMSQEEAERRVNDFLRSEPALSEIPIESPPEALRVRHPGYDTYAAKLDRNVVLPSDRLLELRAAGAIGEVASPAWTFVGATSQLALREKYAPQWAERFRNHRLDGLILVGA